MPRSSSPVTAIVAKCETTMNAAVHTSTAHQPNLTFFSRPPMRMVRTRLPTVIGKESDLDIARRVIRETHEKITREYRSVAIRKCKEQKVELGVLVWVKRETTESRVCKKLCVKWNGPYTVVEALRNYGGYVLKDHFTGQLLKRTAKKRKPFHGEEHYLQEPQDTIFHADLETEVLPPRVCRPPQRYMEEC
ncbi:hypothetical protein E2C01_058024 [Portunus trituberculatus]|uniref:Uncharacterized protein n=1 Tax=Portunus trituberculatus TaxID=210409 RepID=A0A5B7H2N2_PORTR|nr:hypothetical protein [Portunus trituberculatus]